MEQSHAWTVWTSCATGSSSGTSLRLKAKGAPKHGGGRGDLHVKLRIVLPVAVDPALKAFIADWEAGRAFNPREEAAK